MNLQEGIEKLKELLFKEEKPVVLKFETAKLNDGVTDVEWEGDLMVGTIVYVLDSNGSKLPLPLGVYQLEDGSTFEIVDDIGTADKVVKAEVAPAEVAPAPAEVAQAEVAPTPQPVAPAPKRVIKSHVEEHVFSIELENEIIEVDLSSMFSVITTENEKLKNQLLKAEAFSKEIAIVVEQIADEPSKIATEKQVFSETNKKLTAKEISAFFRAGLK